MKTTMSRPALLSLTAVVLLACASPPVVHEPEVPAALRPPAGQKVFLEAFATGVQVYECGLKKDQPGAFEWVFRSPEAKLADRAGKPIGQHYGGPTWEANDGSKVVGEVKGRDPGPDATAIPWLLISAKSTSGSGVLTPTMSIQRVATVGGIAPKQACDAASATQMVRVPYSATYYFYRAAQ
jgi:hypothetical protein